MNNKTLLLVAFGLSNAAALIYQVAWARSLMYVFGSSVYAVSTVLTCFMAGLALGSLVFGWLVDRVHSPVRLFAGLEIGIGVYGFITIAFFGLLSHPYLFLYDLFGASFLFHYVQFLLSLAILIIPTTLIGAIFPVMSKIHAEEVAELGRKVGLVYTADTVGASAGSFAAGLLLIPVIGISKTIILAALLCIGIGIAVYNLEMPVKRRRKR